MKRTLVVLLLTAFCALQAQAQYSRLKDKARNLDDKINERHNAAENGTPPPGPPPKAGAANPATPRPVAAPVKPGNQQQRLSGSAFFVEYLDSVRSNFWHMGSRRNLVPISASKREPESTPDRKRQADPEIRRP